MGYTATGTQIQFSATLLIMQFPVIVPERQQMMGQVFGFLLPTMEDQDAGGVSGSQLQPGPDPAVKGTWEKKNSR